MNLPGRRRWRSRLRDLAAVSAFASVALSGALPAWALIVFAGSFLLSIGGVRPFATRPAISAGVLLVAAAVLFGLAWRGALDLLVAAGVFATLVTGQRMLSDSTRQSDQQVLLASLLLLAGGAALSGELWFAVCLFFYGLFACLALGLGIIEGPVEAEEWLPVRPVVTQLLVGFGFAVVAAVAFFVLFPRLSWNIAARRTPPALFGGTAGMSDRVRLGGGGSLKTNARTVLRARLQPDPRVDRLDQYWVGRVFDTFDGREWQGSGAESPPQPRVRVARAGARRVVQHIELLPPYESRTLVALDTPTTFDQAVGLTAVGPGPVQLQAIADEEVHFAAPANAYRYTATSRAPSDRGRPEAIDRARYLQLPAGLDPRIAALAREWVKGRTTPREQAERLEGRLKATYAYTLELPGELPDPLADFLFDRKAGHCEHFASALTVMLRSLGIPARVTAGFFGGERAGESYVVRGGDAHAWTQAWFEDEGWVLLDATPPEARTAQPGTLLARFSAAYEALEELWRKNVVDYTIIDQWTAVRALVRPPRGAGGGEASLEGLPPARSWAPALGLAVASFVLIRRLLRPARPRPHPAAGFLDALDQRLEAARVGRLEGEPLEELSARLHRAGHRLAVPVGRATQRYLEARFGQRPLLDGERRALLEPIMPPPPPVAVAKVI